ncbi:hypothetical protein PENSPDRAFT_627484 [Peniophora sp. CONT]|nr:hypothetical protein PENSPDRAFT_627484 [Peniophora sp. CONT]
MKFSTSLSVLAFALSASAAPTSDVRQEPPYVTRCEQGRIVEETHREDFPWIKQLYSPCIAGADDKNFWNRKVCVAAAVAMGPRTIVDYGVCDKAFLPEQNKYPYLDYGVYASIVGDCAYDKVACGITRQNLLDLVYSQLKTVKAQIYPTNVTEMLDDVIGPIFTWAGSDAPIKYSVFNKWLQISGYPTKRIDATHDDGETYGYDHDDDL